MHIKTPDTIIIHVIRRDVIKRVLRQMPVQVIGSTSFMQMPAVALQRLL